MRTCNELVLDNMHERLKKLSDAGIIVSIVCGNPFCGGNYFYSVNVLTRNYDEFDKPFAAKSIDHAIEIAEIECKERGWYKSDDV